MNIYFICKIEKDAKQMRCSTHKHFPRQCFNSQWILSKQQPWLWFTWVDHDLVPLASEDRHRWSIWDSWWFHQQTGWDMQPRRLQSERWSLRWMAPRHRPRNCQQFLHCWCPRRTICHLQSTTESLNEWLHWRQSISSKSLNPSDPVRPIFRFHNIHCSYGALHSKG